MYSVKNTLIGAAALAGGALLVYGCGSKDDAKGKTNVLFIIADDFRPELPCYGQDKVVAPNLEALASESTVFTHTYVQYAVSAATRASFLTGCRPATTGVGYPYSEYYVNDFIQKHPTVQRYFHENGFFVRTLGKVHHGLADDFTEKHYNPLEHNYALKENIIVENDKTLRPAVECADVADEAYVDGLVAREAVATIQRAARSGQPFFLAVGFIKPHLPFVAPKKYWDLYERENIPLSEFPEPTLNETPYSRSHYNVTGFAGESDANGHIVSEERARELRHGYYACVSFMDAQVGKVIDELKAQGLYDNTAIVFIGDHGWHLGDNGMWGKQTNFERATHAPLIVKAPKAKADRVPVCNSLTEFVDIYPSLCEMAGLEVPSFVEGTSFVPLLSSNDRKWKTAVFSEHPRSGQADGYTVRTDRYRYVEWREKKGKHQVAAVELYDHANDPLEKVNIAAERPQVCDSLAQVLKAGWKKALPDGVENLSNNPKAPASPGWGPEAEAARARKKAASQASADPMETLMDEAAVRSI